MGHIYKITNKINGKSYIGKTLGSIEDRWREHWSESTKERTKNRPLYRAFKKYGKLNFTIEEIEKVKDSEANIREQYWIEFYKTYGKTGYNATRGGEGKKTVDYEAVIKLYSEVLNKEEVSRVLGVHVDTITKILRENNIDICSSTEILQREKGKQIQLKVDEKLFLFKSINSASRFIVRLKDLNRDCKLTGINQHIKDVCEGKRKTAYGYLWQYAKGR